MVPTMGVKAKKLEEDRDKHGGSGKGGTPLVKSKVLKKESKYTQDLVHRAVPVLDEDESVEREVLKLESGDKFGKFASVQVKFARVGIGVVEAARTDVEVNGRVFDPGGIVQRERKSHRYGSHPFLQVAPVHTKSSSDDHGLADLPGGKCDPVPHRHLQVRPASGLASRHAPFYHVNHQCLESFHIFANLGKISMIVYSTV